MKWPKKNIRLSSGEYADALSPLIITASRATDIPAFYGDAFLDDLKRGYTFWLNRFNGKSYVINLADLRFVVFWTKHCPPSFYSVLEELDRRGIGCYFQYTVNDYEKEGWEGGLPPLADRIALFRRLSGILGPDALVWRYDPLMLSDGLAAEELLGRIVRLRKKIGACTDELVFSFADIDTYPRVRSALRKSAVCYHEWERHEQLEFAEALSARLASSALRLSACAEEADLNAFGIRKGKCVDDERILRISSNDEELGTLLRSGKRLKDPGQRKYCGCIIAKDIGTYGTCRFNCLYCYARY
jgi:hypothetical protein